MLSSQLQERYHLREHVGTLPYKYIKNVRNRLVDTENRLTAVIRERGGVAW